MEEKEIIRGVLRDSKVIVEDEQSIQLLTERGYGEKKNKKIELLPWESIHLASEGWLEIYDEKRKRKKSAWRN